MSLLHPLGRHRLSASELRDENRLLLAREIAAADFFALLMQDRDAVYACYLKAAHDRDTAEALADEYAQQLAAQDAELRELRAFRDNTLAVGQPAGQRDIDPHDQPTQPIKVLTLPQAFGPVVTTPGSDSPTAIPQQRSAS
ncbi:hypothetical protein ACH4D4_04715 [Streptomyces pristinaespiralis]|uniref:hypothetical protein n=1 Tax=Streptomyces pristinaespiralis TaxID=38300 RepID=UPI0037AEA323